VSGVDGSGSRSVVGEIVLRRDFEEGGREAAWVRMCLQV